MKRIPISCAVLSAIAVLALTTFKPYFRTSAEQYLPSRYGAAHLLNFFNDENDGNKTAFLRRFPETVGLKPGIGKIELLPDSKPDQTEFAIQTTQNGKIAFTSSRASSNPEIYTMNPDGSQQTRLTNNNANEYSPTFSPDATRIAFESDRDGGRIEIYVMNADGSNQTRITNNNFNDTDPFFSLDGTKIVFLSDRDGNGEIYIMNVDGSGQTRLTNNTVGERDPTISRDGSKIAFARDTANGAEIYIMNMDGSGQTRLTNNNFHDEHPSFSPDGSKIVFTSFRNGNYDIYIMNVNGTGEARLTTNTGYDWLPSFSPDGTRIAFESSRNGNSDIYVMNSDGTNQTRLTTTGFEGDPDWGATGVELPRITIGDVSSNEGHSGTTGFNFNVTLSRPSGQMIMVDFATDSGSASAAGGDYVSRIGTLTFNPNETSKTITILVNGDISIEGDEVFYVMLSNPINAIFTDRQGNGTIVNDDTQISINDVSLNEGNSGITAFNFTATLSPAIPQAVSVSFATADGTATVANADYNPISGIVSFGPNETNKTITVQVRGDTVIEPNETFFVNLSGAPINVAVADNQGIGTIINDDTTLPTLSINDVSLNEGNSGTTVFTFTVSLSPASTQTVTVNYATANNTAVAPGDYVSISPTALVFGPGETSKPISVSVIGDTAVEPNETFFVNLTTPSNAAISDNQGIGTIVNDDNCSYAINPQSQNFTATGGSGTVQVTAQTGCQWTAVSNPSSVATVFNNTTPITIPDQGTAAPYPSNITVSGMTGTITDLNVRINNFSHSFPDDVAFLLVNPDGTKKFILQSDSGGGTDVVNLTYTFDDQAVSNIPDDGPMPGNNGSIRPSSVGDDDAMPPPAPDTPYSQPASAGTATLNGTFGGINPNGTWKLFVIDFFEGDSGSIGGGWTLDIKTQGAGSWLTVTSGQSGNGSGTVTYSVAQNATGLQRTGTITIAGQTFTVNQSGNVRRTLFDFDGDGRADQTVFRLTNAVWYLLGSSSGFSGVQFGISTDKIVPADFDGDGKTDFAVFRDGYWYWLNSSNGGFNGMHFGSPGDIPVPADYTGDGRAEIAVFRSGIWYTWNLANNQFQGTQFGIASDKPVPADFDGDGKTDFAVYREGVWYHLRSSDGAFQGVQFGIASDKPTVGDYDGDGKADQAVFRSGFWYVLGSIQGFYGVHFGISSDIPVAADYDGDGKTDFAVFRDGIWYLLRSQQGFTGISFGVNIDKPIPAAFVP
ncbi:MAG: DUF5050 domain-containing protein [Acidobacteriota bacterium]|nr:DUF5050 domain-containing protein [Acidobacteriota bacterium]